MAHSLHIIRFITFQILKQFLPIKKYRNIISKRNEAFSHTNHLIK